MYFLPSVVLEEGPELLQTVQRAAVVVLDGLRLEVVEDVLTKLLLKSVAVEPEQALQPIPTRGREGGPLILTSVTLDTNVYDL